VLINGGTVEYGRSGAIPSTADVLFNTASGTATFDTAGFNGTIASLTLGGSANSLAIVDTVGSGTGTLTLGGNVVYDATNNPGRAEISGLLNLGAAARTFTIGDSANTSTDLRVEALVSGSVGLTKSGAGRMDLTNANNSFSGGLTINAGTVRASAGTSAGQSALGTGTVTLAGGELVVYANSAQDPNNPTTVTANSTITSDRLASPFNGLLMTLGQLSIGGQTLTVKPGENISGSRASIGFTGATLSSTPTFDVLDNALLLVGAIGDGSGGFGLVKTGSGTLRLSGSNTYSGRTTISSGTLEVTGDLPGSGGITNNASLVFNRATNQAVSGAIDGTGGLQKLGAGKLTLSSTANTYSGRTTISSGTLEVIGQLPGSGGITNNASLVFNSAANQAVSGAIDGTGGLQKLGAGKLTLSSTANTYSGLTTISAGTLEVTGQLPGSGGITNNASLLFNSAANQAVSGAINGSGGLQKLGAGALSLTSLTNVYTGATAVDAGTLLVNGIHNGGAAYTVAEGATLGGSGGIFATVAGAGTISPGNSPGILAVRSVDPTAGTDFTFEMTTGGDPTWNANTASGNDVLRMFSGSTPITSALTAANTITVNFGMNLTVGDTIRGGFYTERNSDFTSFVSDGDWQYTFTGGLLPEGASIVRSVTQVPSATFTDGTVTDGWVTTFVVVPEPSSLVLVSLGLMGLLWFRRR
jgi:autotransporter-associated beta strand protein